MKKIRVKRTGPLPRYEFDGRKAGQLRRNLRLTQREVADKLEVKWGRLAHWEQGSTLPPMSIRPAWAALLGVPVTAISAGFGGTQSALTPEQPCVRRTDAG